jgi:hypothetical protein
VMELLESDSARPKQVSSRRSGNVVKVTANRGKLRTPGEQKGEKGFAPFCDNLLFLGVLRRLRQDLVNLVSRFASRVALRNGPSSGSYWCHATCDKSRQL